MVASTYLHLLNAGRLVLNFIFHVGFGDWTQVPGWAWYYDSFVNQLELGLTLSIWFILIRSLWPFWAPILFKGNNTFLIELWQLDSTACVLCWYSTWILEGIFSPETCSQPLSPEQVTVKWAGQNLPDKKEVFPFSICFAHPQVEALGGAI